MCVYPNIIIGSQLRLMYGPETNHQSIQIIRAYSNGEREPKGPETRKRNAQAGRFEWIEAAVQQPAERATDCVVFLPGPEEIIDVHERIKLVAPACKVRIVQDEENVAAEDDEKPELVTLSTTIGARSVILDTVRHVYIHAGIPASCIQSSSIMERLETSIAPERVNIQEAGRIGRVSYGLETYS